jgi:hypothetical protein
MRHFNFRQSGQLIFVHYSRESDAEESAVMRNLPQPKSPTTCHYKRLSLSKLLTHACDPATLAVSRQSR